MSAFTRGTRSGGSALHCMAEGSGGPRQVPARGKIHLQPQNLQVRRTITAPPASPLSRSFGAPSYQPNMAHRLCQGESARVEDLDAALRRPVVLACMVGTICCGGNDILPSGLIGIPVEVEVRDPAVGQGADPAVRSLRKRFASRRPRDGSFHGGGSPPSWVCQSVRGTAVEGMDAASSAGS
jgi:hypothetical protein